MNVNASDIATNESQYVYIDTLTVKWKKDKLRGFSLRMIGDSGTYHLIYKENPLVVQFDSQTELQVYREDMRVSSGVFSIQNGVLVCDEPEGLKRFTVQQFGTTIDPTTVIVGHKTYPQLYGSHEHFVGVAIGESTAF